MSRRAPRSRNILRTSRLLTCFLAASALVIGTVVPATAAQASIASTVSSAASASSAVADPASTDIAKSTLVGFNAGNIISDAVFTNENTMTEAQIQSFFNSKVSNCLGGRDENNEPIVCIKDFKMTTVTRPADAYCKGYTGAANESAARIIYRVAQACDINPQVLIVMLQKEQGLVTHTWPSAWRYRIALGQGCPDTAPCDPNYIGFFHQIYGAARQMQIYMEGKWFQWYAPGNTWNILYNPNSACGTSRVYIANKATAALYYYTPYQPNAAALRAGYGLGDGCSAYGNRNFYNYFTDWFGSTQSSQPAVAPPTLKSVDTVNYIVAADKAGTVWGYPYSKKVWGTKVELASGVDGVTDTIDLGDFDGDGDRDFMVLDANRNVQVLRSDGGTKLDAPEPAPGDWSGVTDVFAAGDFDGDGVVDVFTTSADGTLFLRAGTGFGGFRAPVRVGSGWHKMSQVSGGLDMNGDSKPDLVARNAAGYLYLYTSDGRGGWGSKILMGHGWEGMTGIFGAGDFDGDGKSDLFAHRADGKLLLYRGIGGGKVTGAGTVGSGWATMASKTAVGTAVAAPRTFPGGFGNVDAIAGNDVVATTKSGEAYIYGGNGAGKWGTRSTIGSNWGADDLVTPLGDFNRDGYSDFGRIDAQGFFQFYAGKPGGGFADPIKIGHGWEIFDRAIGGLDFDGDRITDLLVTTSDGTMHLYRGNGQGGWITGGGAQISHGWTIADDVFYAGDFDGDGRGDLLARLTDGTLRSYPLTGNSSFATASQLGHGWDIFDSVLSPGDFDGDGKSDLLAIAPDGLMYLYAGLGNGKMQSRVKIGSGWNIMASVG
ncbi:VCBS repeat-containing protein [Microbacterium sp. NPDC076768]|uniref:FG-GAP repeat domain-containing protein n=1 Tax=Microbacterium sp. NPDC076768 TaxID=3154858 RepID=UPI0034193F02